MKLLFDFFPIVLFFIAYKFFDIYAATVVAMAASLVQVAVYWFKHKQFESLHVITLITVVLLGGATLMLHNTLFIKWKPTAIYWVFAIVFLLSQFIGKRPLIQRMMDKQVTLPRTIWVKLNLSWSLFFLVMGAINLYVVYHFSTNAWVNFKLFGTLGLFIIFIVGQAVYMSKYMTESKELIRAKVKK